MGVFKPKGPFPLFIHDLEVDTKGWSAEERYQYLRLLTSMWRSGGSIEDSDEAIAEEMGLNRARNWREKVEKVRYKLESHPTQTGFLTQHRIAADIGKAAAISQKRADAGRKGGSKSPSNSLPEQQANAPLARAVPSPSKKKKDSVSKQLLVDQQFETWWPHVPKKVDQEDARKVFKTALKKIDLQTLIVATDRWAETMIGTEPKYIRGPARWLRGQCWKNEDVAPAPELPMNGAAEPYMNEFEDDLRTDYRRLMRWQTKGEWMEHWGPKPGEPDCQIAAEVMTKYGASGQGREA